MPEPMTTSERIMADCRRGYGHGDECATCQAIAIDVALYAKQRYDAHVNPPFACCVGDKRTDHAADCPERREYRPAPITDRLRRARRPGLVPLVATLRGRA
jgi:hypothetical protein